MTQAVAVTAVITIPTMEAMTAVIIPITVAPTTTAALTATTTAMEIATTAATLTGIITATDVGTSTAAAVPPVQIQTDASTAARWTVMGLIYIQEILIKELITADSYHGVEAAATAVNVNTAAVASAITAAVKLAAVVM